MADRTGSSCSVFLLGSLNAIFLLLGLGFLVLGIILKVDAKFLDENDVISTFNEVSINNNLKMGSLVSSLPVLTICIGVFIFGIATLGFTGACCKNRPCLFVYGIIVSLLVIVQIVAVVFWVTMKTKTEKAIKDHLLFAMNKYEGVQSANEISKGWDFIFIGLDCCGIDAVGPSNTEEFNGTVWWPERGWNKIPFSCCQIATSENLNTGRIDVECTTLQYGYRTKGCYQAIQDYLWDYETAAILIGVCLLITELLAVVLAFMLCRSLGQTDSLV